MSRQVRLRFAVIPSTSKSTVSRSVTDDSSQPNENQDNDDGNSTSSDCSPSVFDHVEGSDCEEETDQNVHATTVAKPMLSVKIHTEPPSDLAAVPTESPTQPKINFPLRQFGMGRPRGFNRDWYKSYQWLEYSVERDAAFCFPCRMFKVGSSRCESTFTVTGFRNWKHAMGQKGIITSHDKCDVHKQAMIDWKQYKINMQHHTSVQDRNNSVCSQQIHHNRHYIKTIAEVLRLCAMQDLALRGHREGEDSHNPGNFLKILELIGNHDSVVGEKLRNGPQNATYTSPEIQNSVLHIMGEMLRSQICVEIKKARVFSLLVDETKDASKIEQLAIVFRYVDIESASIHERFLTFVPDETLNAEGLSNLIIKTLEKYHIDPMLMVSQGYDGAAVMSGHCSGVQTRIRQVAPKALYVHCNAHCLNLCLVDCAKSVSCAAEFFGLVQNIYVFLCATQYMFLSSLCFIQESLLGNYKGSQILDGLVVKVPLTPYATHLMLLWLL